MYATIGYIVPEYYKFPGYLSPSLGLKFSDVPNGLAALSKCRPYQGDARDRQRMITVQDATVCFCMSNVVLYWNNMDYFGLARASSQNTHGWG